jgi:hypothetical protein
VVQVQPVGEVEVAEEQGGAPGGAPEGQNQGQGELHQPPLLPSPHPQQFERRWQAQAHHPCRLRDPVRDSGRAVEKPCDSKVIRCCTE